VDHVLIALAVLAVLALFVLCSPTKTCRSCINHRGPCPRCKGTGKRFRSGARLVRCVILLAYKQPWRTRDGQ
jgi:hypothetical protein